MTPMVPVMPVVVVMPMASVMAMPVLDGLQKALMRAYPLRALLRRQSGGLTARWRYSECESETDRGDAHKFHG
jgi:hypothetical protein